MAVAVSRSVERHPVARSLQRDSGGDQAAEFEACLLSWITALHEITAGQIVAIDGKTLRRSFDAATSKSAIHMVSAWATANHISLGQVVVDEKSNEITAIPKLLKMLEISGCLVTIDAMGCQTEIAQAILDAKADYVLAVKDNQPTLPKGLRPFVDHAQDDFAASKQTPLPTRKGTAARRVANTCLPSSPRLARRSAVAEAGGHRLAVRCVRARQGTLECGTTS